MNPFEKNKTIFHIDYDSFFASVEQQFNPSIRNKPVAVTGGSINKGITVAASKEAKKYGIKTGTPIFKALKMCPNLNVVKGDFEKYNYIQKESIKIFNKYTDFVESFSIDEAFLDVTSTLNLFKSSENIITLIKKDIKNKFGQYITCSIGVGPNKLMAKLCSDINKPNGHVIVTPQNINNILLNTPLPDFCGIGQKTTEKLYILNIYTIVDLQKAPLQLLYKEFGKVTGSFLKNTSFGIDYNPVKHISYKIPVKSVSHQHTLYKNTNDTFILLSNLRRLTELVGKRLRNNQMTTKFIFISLKSQSGTNYSKTVRLQDYTDSGQVLYKHVQKLYFKIAKTDFKYKKHPMIRRITIGVTELKHKTVYIKPLFEIDLKQTRLDTAIDKINDRFGNFTIVSADSLMSEVKHTKMSSFLRH